jgi:hypothetical protein
MDSKEFFEAGLYNGWLKWRVGQGKAADDHRARVSNRRAGGYEDAPVARAGGIKSYKKVASALGVRKGLASLGKLAIGTGLRVAKSRAGMIM